MKKKYDAPIIWASTIVILHLQNTEYQDESNKNKESLQNLQKNMESLLYSKKWTKK